MGLQTYPGIGGQEEGHTPHGPIGTCDEDLSAVAHMLLGPQLSLGSRGCRTGDRAGAQLAGGTEWDTGRGEAE